MKQLEVMAITATLEENDEIVVQSSKNPHVLYIRNPKNRELIFICSLDEQREKLLSKNPVHLVRYLRPVTDFKEAKWNSYADALKLVEDHARLNHLPPYN